MRSIELARRGCLGLVLTLQLACDREPHDGDAGDETEDGAAPAEPEMATTGATGLEDEADDHTSTSSTPDASTDDDGSTSSDAGSVESSDEGSSSAGAPEPACIDPHFVTFLAPDGDSFVDVPEGIEVTRMFADGSTQTTDCQSAAHGECLIACVVSELAVDLLELAWPCGDASTVAIHREVAPAFLLAVDVAAVEAAAGCG